MPKPPYPNAIRAVIGFPLGLITSLVVVALIRVFVFEGIGAYLVDVDLGVGGGLFRGWFWNDEGTFALALLGGLMGFLWGAGAVYDEEKYAGDSGGFSPLALLSPGSRIPADPDAPRISHNPLAGLFGTIPAIIYIIAVLIALSVWLASVIAFERLALGPTFVVIILAGLAFNALLNSPEDRFKPSPTAITLIAIIILFGFATDLGVIPKFLPTTTSEQTGTESSQTDVFGEADYNFVGLIELEGQSQAALFVFFAVFVVFNIIGIAATIALVMYLLNGLVNTVATVDSEPIDSDSFVGGIIMFVIRLTQFFTEWALDIVNGVGNVVRPR